MSLELFRFNQIQDYYKNLFLEGYKEDLADLTELVGYDNLMSILNERNKKIYENVMEAETYKEFNLLMKNYYLSNQIKNLKIDKKNLKKKNKSLKNEKNKIKQEYDIVLNENKELLGSKSWKITKPLRKICNYK